MKSFRICIIYVIILLVMSVGMTIPIVADSVQTRNVLTMMMIVIAIVVCIMYLIKSLFIKEKTTSNVALNGLLLWILSEFVFLCIGGELAVFGLVYELGFYDKLAKDILEFRESRNLVFSISFAASALLATVSEKMWIRKG